MAHEPATSPRPLLAASGLTKAFQGLMALKDHRIVVHEREIVGVIGPNGSGKSTFFNLVTGFTLPDAGRVGFDGRAIQGLRPSRITRLGIARTFQGTRLFPQLTVRENVAAAAQLRHRTGLADAVLGTDRLAQVEAKVASITDELLRLIGLAGSDRRRAGDLAY